MGHAPCGAPGPQEQDAGLALRGWAVRGHPRGLGLGAVRSIWSGDPRPLLLLAICCYNPGTENLVIVSVKVKDFGGF